MARTNQVENIRERAVELGVYLPLGAYAKVREEMSDLSAPRVRKVFEDLIQRGESRVDTVERIIRRRGKGTERKAKDAARSAVSRAKSTAKKTTKRAEAAADAIAPKLPRVAAPKKASELPIKGYAGLTANEITSELKGLTQTELAKVYKFEKAHDDRQTILDAIESKLTALPIPTYDALTVDEIIGRLDKLDGSELKTLRRYEAETKDRTTVIEKIDSLLS
ncbi:MAG: hypothetical protein QOG54_1428 [Actinomycetota bacterium]|jgi:hypothetical protein|nr:hypothetical protein [Actinomycetota bacterium]